MIKIKQNSGLGPQYGYKKIKVEKKKKKKKKKIKGVPEWIRLSKLKKKGKKYEKKFCLDFWKVNHTLF